MTLTMHVLPVGTSLVTRINNGELGELEGVLAPETFHRLPHPVDTVRQALRQATNPDTLDLDLDGLVPEAARTTLADETDYRLCAEWNSVAASMRRTSSAGEDEAFVLIATDTDEGLRAAALVATHYTHKARIRYVDDPSSAGPMLIEPGGLYICRVPELDLAAKNPPEQTWHALGSVGHAIQATATQAAQGRWRVVLHLSGGYKALIPYLLVMAEGINSVFGYRDRTVAERAPILRAIALHESSVDDADRDPIVIDLPIRTLPPKLFTKAVELKPHIGSHGQIHGDTWDDLLGGLLIERAGQRRWLNPAGIIMVGVL